MENTYSVETTTEKMTIATKAVEEIENNQGLTQRVINTLKTVGAAALAKFLSHLASSFIIVALDDWQKSKKGLVSNN
ncbi:hypothetical protein VV11_018225 [Trichodesmium erythraeum 21-75]|nr:hypothetical protein [Trichodesmium erythraeum 21-75]